jgi:hypothetical protein
VLVVVAVRYSVTLGAIDQFAVQPTYNKVDLWIESSACVAETRTYFVVCEGSELIPIEAENLADDRGHLLFANIMAHISGDAISRSDLVRFNLGINFLAIIILALLVNHLVGARYASLTALAAVLVATDTVALTPDSEGAYLAAAIITALPVLYMMSSNIVAWHSVLWAPICVATAQLLREPYALLGMVLIFSAVVWCLYNRKITVLLAAVIISGVTLAATVITPALFEVREFIWNIDVRDDLVLSHHFSHTLVGGIHDLIGIEYDDFEIYEAVLAAFPHGGAYASKEYYDTALEYYWQVLHEAPIAVFLLYFDKLNLVLTQSWKLEHFVVVILSSVLFFLSLWRCYKLGLSGRLLTVLLILFGFVLFAYFQFAFLLYLTLSCLIDCFKGQVSRVRLIAYLSIAYSLTACLQGVLAEPLYYFYYPSTFFLLVALLFFLFDEIEPLEKKFLQSSIFQAKTS